MSASGKRTAWPDWVKGIGILSIVMAHVTQYFPGGASYLNKILCSYHVPVFLRLRRGKRGIMARTVAEVERRDFYLKRVRRFLIPYVLFSLFNSALKLLQYFGKESLLVMLIHPTVLLFFTYPFGRNFAAMTGVLLLRLRDACLRGGYRAERPGDPVYQPLVPDPEGGSKKTIRIQYAVRPEHGKTPYRSDQRAIRNRKGLSQKTAQTKSEKENNGNRPLKNGRPVPFYII